MLTQIKSLKKSESNLVIDEILDYSEDFSPIWGTPIGVWNYRTSNLAYLSPQAFEIYNKLDNLNEFNLVKNTEGNNQLLQLLREENLIHEKDFYQGFADEVKVNFAELYVETTEACNLSCPGCAVGSDIISPKEAKTLTQEDINLYISSFFKSANEKKVEEIKIKWAGGEPLIEKAFKLIGGAQSLINRLSDKFPNISVDQVVLSNGVSLTQKQIEILKENNIRISISLWGIGENQDLARKPKSQKETYPIIIENIRKAYAAGVYVTATTVVTPNSMDDWANIIELFWDTESENYIFKDFPEHLKKQVPLNTSFFRPQNHLQLLELQNGGYDKMAKSIRKGLKKILSMIHRGIRIPSLAKIDYLTLLTTTPVVCGTGINYIAVGPEGAASCHEHLLGMSSNKERLQAGENIFDIVNHKHAEERELLVGYNLEHADELEKALSLHGGTGCPNQRIKESGDQKLGKKSASSISLNKQITKELLSLEILRCITNYS